MCNLSKGVEEKGFLIGCLKSLLSTAEAYRETGLPDSEIVKRLMKKFSLSEQCVQECLAPDDNDARYHPLPPETKNGIVDMVNALATEWTTPEEKKRFLREEFQISITPGFAQALSDMYYLGQEIEKSGIAKGLLEGIPHTIMAYREMGVPDSEIVKRIMEKYFSTEQETMAYLRELDREIAKGREKEDMSAKRIGTVCRKEKAEGLQEGKILGAIQVYRSLNTPEEETLKRIMSLFSLTEEEARGYMAEAESE